ncbi:MAG: glutamyl-tRNA reductase [Sarcina sp.]
MIVLVGIRKNIDLHIREKFAITENHKKYLQSFLEVFDEAVIINTCNRTEIYVNSQGSFDVTVDKIFEVLEWDRSLKEHCFTFEDSKTIKHLFEVISGFHSRITGEDQILGQVKDAFKIAQEEKAVSTVLNRLFQNAIGCGKKFRTMSKLYEIPVSSASIAVNQAMNSNVKSMIIIGFGDVGRLVHKYALGAGISQIIVIVRNVARIKDIESNKTRVMTYNEAKSFFDMADVIVSCTSSREIVLRKDDINEIGKELQIFDLAVPRDVDEKIRFYSRVSLSNIDDISKIDDSNKISRKKRMYENRYIITDAIATFEEWLKLREISEDITDIRRFSAKVTDDRCKTFYNKSKAKEDIKLANLMIKSTSDTYMNKAIEVLKEEKLKGNEDECLRILKAIFS